VSAISKSSSGNMTAEEEEEEDYEGLKAEYDIILYGTGLVESILACAAARAGKSVLHLDKNGFYGRECTSGSLEFFLAQNRQPFQNNGVVGDLDIDFNVGGDDETLREAASDATLNFASITEQSKVQARVVDFSDIKSGDSGKPEAATRRDHEHPACLKYVMEKSPTHDDGVTSANCHPCFFDYIRDHRMTSKRALLKSRFFNIDSSVRLLFGSTSSIDAIIASGISKYLEFKSVEGIFFLERQSGDFCAVPCNKGEIFTSKLLNALEKRSLMKFLQLTIDWGQNHEGNTVSTLNERELAQGRSLKRPQNKKQVVQQQEPPEEAPRNPCAGEEDFRLHLDSLKVSKRLQDVIIHALCLHGGGTLRSEEAMKFLYQHMNALGKFGETAFLSIMYGSAELPQAFCRMCAVWGGTYVLRRAVSSLLLSPSSDGTIRVSAVRDSTGKLVKCRAFVCNAEDWPRKNARTTSVFSISKICIVDAHVLSRERSFAVIPPEAHGLGNTSAVYIVQMDSSAAVAPEGAVVLHIMSTVTSSLSATDGLHDDDFLRSASQLMHRIVDFLTLKVPFRVLCTTTSIRPLFDPRDALIETAEGKALTNVAVCGESSLSLHTHDFFEQAKEIFAKLFPGEPFLPSNGKNSEGDEGEDDVDDDDIAPLEKALSSINALSDVPEEEQQHDEPSN